MKFTFVHILSQYCSGPSRWMAADAQFSLQRDNELRFETSQRHIAIKNEEKKVM
jgi:hypothetical protein